MNTTMEDIARQCGVTKMTVSRVLAGKNYVKPATRERILAVAKRMKYEVNSLARNFTNNRSGFVAVATAFEGLLGSPYFSEVFAGFEQVLQATNLDFAMFNTHRETFNNGAKLAKLYHQRRVDGLFVVAAHTDDHFIGTLAQAHVPMVVVGEHVPASKVCSISCHDAEGIRMVCEHLYELGHRKIAFVEGPKDFLTAIRRKRAFMDFCKDHSLTIPSAFLQPGAFTMRSGREAGHALLTSSVRPTAVVVANDVMAFGVIESARALGLDVPGDLSVTGFDDLPTAVEHFPALTTIHQPVREMGVMAAEMLLNAIPSGKLPAKRITLDVRLIVRDSTRSRRG